MATPDYSKVLLKGDDYAFQMNVGTEAEPDFRTIICDTDGTLNLSTESIDARNGCNPMASVPGQISGTKDITVQDLPGVTGADLLTNSDMFYVWSKKLIMQWRLIPKTTTPNCERYTFSGSVTAHNKTTTVGTIVTTANTITINEIPLCEKNTGTADDPVWTPSIPSWVKA